MSACVAVASACTGRANIGARDQLGRVAKGKHPHDGRRPIGKAWRVVIIRASHQAAQEGGVPRGPSGGERPHGRVQTALDEGEWEGGEDDEGDPTEDIWSFENAAGYS